MRKKAIRLGVTLLLLSQFCFATVLASSPIPSSGFTKNLGRVVLDHSRQLTQQMNRPNVIYEVRNDFDLAGSHLKLPPGCIIEFNGGHFYNGLIFGDKMPTSNPYKPEDFGAGLSDDTYAIQSCLNICHSVVLDGNYQVSNRFKNKNNVILSIPSETKVFLNGVINLSPVDSPTYSIFSIKNSNTISITGRGQIVGDRETTNVVRGQHGMGVSITGLSSDIIIDGLNISKCFGDAIYIGTEVQEGSYLEPYNIVIKNCELHHCRRQFFQLL